ncbi:MAG: hypothetical protein JWR26_698 [Pedosphaera sp.]|nr:hypothetical protein [Pedosphaera sp.]
MNHSQRQQKSVNTTNKAIEVTRFMRAVAYPWKLLEAGRGDTGSR